MDKIEYYVETAKDGNLTLIARVNGREYPLHSRINPLKEKISAELGAGSGNDILIVLGCGIGYHLLSLKERLSSFSKIIIIDILSGIVEHIKNSTQTSFLMDHRNIEFFCGFAPRELEPILLEEIDFSSAKGLVVIEHPASLRIFDTYYSEVKGIIKRVIDKRISDAATVKAFGRVFLRNALNNLKNFDSLFPVSLVKDEFVDGDCLIVSSAPSAESYMGYIRAYQDGLYIIAVDSAVPMLQKNGVNPDFVISIDPQGRIHEHFLGVNYSFIPIFSLVSPPSIVAQYKGMLSLNSHPLSQIIESLFPSVVGSIDSGTGSVAGDSLRFARLCGFKNIGMIGFDFCFNDNLIYSRGTAYQDRYSLMFNNRFLSPESFNGSYIFRGTSTLIEESKYTRRNFLNYRDGLSRIIRGLDSSIVFINDIGLRVDGALYKSFEDFISLCSLKRKGNNLRERLFYRRKRLNEILDLQYLLKFLMREDLARELSIESYGRNNFDINIKRLTKVLHSINLST